MKSELTHCSIPAHDWRGGCVAEWPSEGALLRAKRATDVTAPM